MLEIAEAFADTTALYAAYNTGNYLFDIPNGNLSNAAPDQLTLTLGGSFASAFNITNGTWSVSVMGVTVLSGSAANAEKATKAEGVQNLSSVGPLSWVLKGGIVVPVSGQVSGQGGTCSGSGYITGTGSPAFSLCRVPQATHL